MAAKKKQTESSALVLSGGSSVAALREMFDPSLVAGALTSTSGGLAPKLKLDDGVIMDGQNEVGNELDIVILGVAVEHALYPSAYNAEQREDPVCFYVGTSEKDAAPDKASPLPQAESCARCAKNAFGSHSNGRGKACGQRRRLLVLPLGEGEDAAKAQLHRITTPPTSNAFVDGYVKMVEGLRPLQSVVTHFYLERHPQHKFHAKFEPARQIDDRATLEKIARRAEEGKGELFSVWQPRAREGQVEQKTGRRVVKRG